MEELPHLVDVFNELDELNGGVCAQNAQTWIISRAWKIGIESCEGWIVEEVVVCPVAVDGSSKAFLLVREQKPSVVGIVPPSDLWVQLRPSICYFPIFHHFHDQLDCQLWRILSLDDSTDDNVAAYFCAQWLAALVWFIAYHQFVEIGEGAEGIVHGSFEEMGSTTKIYTVVSFGCLCQMKEVLDCCIFADLLQDLRGEFGDRHFNEFKRLKSFYGF